MRRKASLQHTCAVCTHTHTHTCRVRVQSFEKGVRHMTVPLIEIQDREVCVQEQGWEGEQK